MEQLNNNMNLKKNKPNYKQLSNSERVKIQNLYHRGYSCTMIAKSISRDKNTVSHEIRNHSKRNLPSISNARNGIKEFHYSANIAQQKRDDKFMWPRFHKKFKPFIKFFNKNINPHKTIEEICLSSKNKG